MTWDTLQQFIRMVALTAGGYFLGDAVVQGEQFQLFVAGLINIAAFGWWLYWNNVGRPDA